MYWLWDNKNYFHDIGQGQLSLHRTRYINNQKKPFYSSLPLDFYDDESDHDGLTEIAYLVDISF